MSREQALSGVEPSFHPFLAALILLAALLIIGPARADSPADVAGAKTILTAEAKALHDQGAVFVDVRSSVLWDAGRIPGAHFLPKEEVTEAALTEIAGKGDPVVFYCQGLKCPNSSEACVKALEWGYSHVYYYREGYPAWQAAGLAIE